MKKIVAAMVFVVVAGCNQQPVKSSGVSGRYDTICIDGVKYLISPWGKVVAPKFNANGKVEICN